MAELDEKRVGDYFERLEDVTDWWTPEEGELRFHYEAELRVLEEQLAIDPAWRVLDVGTGRGRFGALFARHGCRVLGVDLNAGMCAEARETAKRLGVEDRFEVTRGSAEDLSGLPEAAFDVVLCMELFDHLPDLAKALEQMRGRLAPGGRFLFTYVPGESVYGLLGNAYRFARSRLAPGELMISRTYSLGEVRDRLAEQGLRLERYWGVGLLCANAQTRLLQGNPLLRALTAVARGEARRWPYYERPWLARHGAHVVGLARAPVA